jgi:hypothetical protein
MASSKTSKQADHSHSSSSISEYLPCGYEVNDIERLSPKCRCIYCILVIKEPIQLTECGHRCCKGCFESRAAASIDDKMLCPVPECDTKFSKNQVRIIFISTKSCKDKLSIFILKIMTDRAFKKELDVLVVACTHKTDKKCPWTGQLQFYQVCIFIFIPFFFKISKIILCLLIGTFRQRTFSFSL